MRSLCRGGGVESLQTIRSQLFDSASWRLAWQLPFVLLNWVSVMIGPASTMHRNLESRSMLTQVPLVCLHERTFTSDVRTTMFIYAFVYTRTPESLIGKPDAKQPYDSVLGITQ